MKKKVKKKGRVRHLPDSCTDITEEERTRRKDKIRFQATHWLSSAVDVGVPSASVISTDMSQVGVTILFSCEIGFVSFERKI